MDYSSNLLSKIFSDESLNPKITLFNINTYKDGDKFFNHTHKGAAELMYVFSGYIFMQVNSHYVKITKNECLVIFPDTVHNLILKKNEKCRAACLVFSPGALESISELDKPDTFSFLFELMKDEKGYIKILANYPVRNVIEKIYSNHINADFSKELHKLYFCELYIHMSEEINRRIKRNMHTTNQYISKALKYISNNYTSPVSVEDVAEEAELSKRHLSRLFLSELSMSIHEYINFLRIEKSKTLLSDKHRTISSISADLGFSSPQHFATTFKNFENLSPGKFRKEN